MVRLYCTVHEVLHQNSPAQVDTNLPCMRYGILYFVHGTIQYPIFRDAVLLTRPGVEASSRVMLLLRDATKMGTSELLCLVCADACVSRLNPPCGVSSLALPATPWLFSPVSLRWTRLPPRRFRSSPTPLSCARGSVHAAPLQIARSLVLTRLVGLV